MHKVKKFTPRRALGSSNGNTSSTPAASRLRRYGTLPLNELRAKLEPIIRAKFKQGKTEEAIWAWLDRENRRLGEPFIDDMLGMVLREVSDEVNPPVPHEVVTPATAPEEFAGWRAWTKAERSRVTQARRLHRIEEERNSTLIDVKTGREIPPGHPDYFSSTDTKPQHKKKAKATRPRVYLSQAMRDWLARLRREGEHGLLTITQNIANMLALLPPQEAKAYVYMRALMLHPEHPGSFYISHDTLAKNLNVSRATAERITQHLRQWKLIRLAKRGGSWGAANHYVILPLTQDLLDALRKRFTPSKSLTRRKEDSPSPVRGSTPSPMRDRRLSYERKSPGPGLRGPGPRAKTKVAA
jgi:hypothetical protein